MEDLIEMKWKRPESSVFPKVWHTFTAKDADSERLVEYRIEDISESRSEEAVKIMAKNFLRGEPLCIAFGIRETPFPIYLYSFVCQISSIISKNLHLIGVAGDPVAENDIIRWLWEPIVKQKMALVCYKSGLDEIVGLNMNFVASKDEHFFEEVQKKVRIFQ